MTRPTTAASELRRPPAGPSQWATVTRLGRSTGAHPAPTAGQPPVDGSLAIQETAPFPVPGRPETPELRLVRAEAPTQEEVQVWAGRFAQAVVEVLGGDRPQAQLVRWTSHRVYQELGRRLTVINRASAGGRRTRSVRPQVRSVHVCRPTAEAAEVSVHVRHGERSRAIAARLELVQGRWQCTALQLG
jgi:hypothetical protein